MFHKRIFIAGHYKLSKPGWQSPWFNNLIVNDGLDLLGSLNNVQACLATCQLGSGKSAVTPTQTTLDNLIVSSSTITTTENISQYSSPYWIGIRNQYSFPVGSINSTVREIGVTDSSNTLFSRAVLPEPIEVLADESLDVFYEFLMYMEESDIAWSDTINTNPTTGLIRPARIDEAVFASNQFIHGNTGLLALDGALGSIVEAPTGNQTKGSFELQPYVPGTYYRDIKLDFGEFDGNLTNGISVIYTNPNINNAAFPCLQISIDPPVMKTSKDVFHWLLRYSWGRL